MEVNCSASRPSRFAFRQATRYGHNGDEVEWAPEPVQTLWRTGISVLGHRVHRFVTIITAQSKVFLSIFLFCYLPLDICSQRKQGLYWSWYCRMTINGILVCWYLSLGRREREYRVCSLDSNSPSEPRGAHSRPLCPSILVRTNLYNTKPGSSRPILRWPPRHSIE